MKKAIPIGISLFEKIRLKDDCNADYYYVDKTLLIKELLTPRPTEVTLITRPRRFGKSLNMSMLECFLDIERKDEGMALFEGLAISRERKVIESHMHKYPVIHVSFKDVSASEGRSDKTILEMTLDALRNRIGFLALRYGFLKDSKQLSDEEKILYQRLTTVSTDSKETQFAMNEDTLKHSLEILSGLVRKHYGVKPVLLIDEYDVPLNEAFEKKYYDQFVGIYRTLLNSALKDSDNISFAVVTGCLKISKESIFTGLNNLWVIDVTSDDIDDYYGFSDEEVGEMLEYYGLSEYREGVKKFYDGYQFGSRQAYNPWTVAWFVRKAMASMLNGKPAKYTCGWINTSSNSILYNLMEKAEGDMDIADDVDTLENGGTIRKKIIDQLTFDSIYNSIDGIWTVMLHTGYLTCEQELDDGLLELRIPNEEVLLSFDEIVGKLAKRQAEAGKYQKAFCEAVRSFDPAKIENALNDVLENSVSIRDTATKESKENFYHGIMNAILLYRDDWERRSNPEAGRGYCDILVENPEEDWGVIFELKYSDDMDDFSAALDEGERQIFKCKYAKILKRKRYTDTHLYSIAFHGKECKVREVFA